MPVASRSSEIEGLSAMAAMSQIVNFRSSAKSHNLCVATPSSLSHIVSMAEGDKNGGAITLKAWRKAAEMSQAALADAVGTNANMIGYLESGERALTALWMRKLAPHLGAAPADLIDNLPDEVPTPTTDELAAIVQDAILQLPPGSPASLYPRAVAAAVHAQLKQIRVHGVYREPAGEGISPDIAAQSLAPTKQSDRAGKRNRSDN